MWLMKYAFLLNAVMILMIVYASFRIQSLLHHLALIFLYISVHYTYGILPILLDSEASFQAFNQTRIYTHPIFPVMGLVCVAYLLFFPFVKYRQALNVLPFQAYCNFVYIRLLIGFMLMWAASLSVLFFLNEYAEVRSVVKLLLIQCITILCAFLLAYYFCVILKDGFKKREAEPLINGMFIFTALMTMIVFCEMFLRKTWVCCAWVRPSALLLNPNNLAFWYLVVAGVFSIAYLLDVKEKIASLGIILAAVGMFLTGSRSIFIIYIFFSILLVPSVLMLKGSIKKGLKTVLYFYLPFGLLCVVPQLMEPSSEWIGDFQKTSARYLLAIPLIVEYFFNAHQVNLSDTYFAKHFIVSHYAPYSGINLANNGVTNLEGRFSETSTDNAYLMMLHHTSWQLVFSWGLLVTMPLFFCSLYAIIRQCLVGAMLAVLYMAILLAGLSINIFLVFPDWVMVSSFIGVLLAWISVQRDNPARRVV